MQAKLIADLKLFSSLSKESYQLDFCRTALGFLQEGTSGARKKLQGAAKGLGASFEDVEATIAALAMIMMLTTKNKLNQPRIKMFVSQLDLPEGPASALCSFLADHAEQLNAIVEAKDVAKLGEGSSAQRVPELKDFKWRFEVQVASRRAAEHMSPSVALKFETDQGTKECSCDYAALRRLRDELTAAKEALDSVHAQRISRYIR